MNSISFSKENKKIELNLPSVKISENKPLTDLLENRQSVREFKDKQLSLEQVSLILWAATGKKVDAVSSASRSVPSAGACYPVDVYLYAQENGVKGIGAGFYKYLPDSHSLKLLPVKIDNQKLVGACWNQTFVVESPALIIITAQFRKTTKRYGKRGERYVFLDAGHVGENIYLMATQLKLATVEVGAFDDFALANSLELPTSTKPILVMPIGYRF